MYLNRRALLLLGASMAAVGNRRADAADLSGAQHFVEDLGKRAIAVLGRQGVSAEERQRELGQLLDDSFDMPLIAKLVLGQAFRQLTPQQLADYNRVFHDFVLHTYSARLSAYTGEQLTVVRATPASGQDVVVASKVARSGAAPTQVEWRVRGGEGGFKIIDVLVEGVSMIVTQRSEFQSIVQSRGIDGLMATLRTRIERATGSAPQTG